MHLYQYTFEEINKTANVAKLCMINGLLNFGEITEEQAKNLDENYTIVVSEKGIFGKALDKFFGKDEKGTLRFQLVKVTK